MDVLNLKVQISETGFVGEYKLVIDNVHALACMLDV